MNRAAPGDAATFGLDHASQGRDIEVYWGERLHRVGRARRRGDCAGRRLGHDEAVRCDDRDDNRGGSIARQPADAVLVYDDRRIPAQAVADLDHGARQVGCLILVKRQGGARRQEGGEMHIGVAAGDNVFDDCRESGRIEAIAVDAPAHACQRFERGGMRDLNGLAVRDAKDRPGGLRERDLVERDQLVALDLEEGCLHLSAAARDENLRACGKTLRTADMAVCAHDHDRLMLCVHAQTLCAERRLCRAVRPFEGYGHRSNT
jgi:hypothetical protein